MLCSCPKKAALTSIKTVVCPEKFGQIQKAAFVRLTNGGGVKNGFKKTSDDITAKASWTKLLTAADDTKVVVTPYIEAPSGEAGEARTFGGGNETLGGIERIIGRNPSTFTGVFRDVPQEIIKAIKELQCEDGNLGVYLFDQYGHIEALGGASEGDALPFLFVRSLSPTKTTATSKAPTATTCSGLLHLIIRTTLKSLCRLTSTPSPI